MSAQVELGIVQFLYCMSLFTVLIKKCLTKNILLTNNLKD